MRGYGLLAAAWLTVLGAGGLVGGIAYQNGPDARPVASAALHTGALPDRPRLSVKTAADATGPAAAQAAGHPAWEAVTAPSADRPMRETDAGQSRTGSPTAVQLASRAPGLEASSPPPPAVPRALAPPSARTEAAEVQGRYSVQVGAFRQRANALARAQRLRAAGYEVRVVHLFATRSRLYMVRLGQFDARPAAIAYARQLARDVEVETWPVRN
jgi:cell division septation protein DedD